MESDGWEEPRRGVSTRPALVPARQGMAEPARNSNGCGGCLGVETHSHGEWKWDPKIQAHLPPPVREIPDVCRHSSAAWDPAPGAHGTGVPLARCVGGRSGSRAASPPCLISGHLHHPQNANYLQHGALTQKSEGRQAYRQPRSPRGIKCTHTVSSLLAKGRQTLPASLVWGCHAPCS